MKKGLMIITILVVLGLFFAATSQVAASPNSTSLLAKTQTPHGQSGTPHGQSGEHGKRVHLRGTIALVDAASLTLTLKDSTTVTVSLTADTRIKVPSLGKDAGVSDLLVGANVNVQATKGEDESLSATMILVVPGKPALAHHVGTVTDYQPGASITIQDNQGNNFTYLLTADTKILPEERAGLLAVGFRVTIIAGRDVTGGPLTASGIVIHPAGAGSGSTP